MTVKFDRDLLIQAVSYAMGTVSGKSTVASIEGILIKAEGGKCILSSFDLEKGMEINIDADIVTEGSYIINAQKLNQIVRAMPQGELTIDVDARNITKIYSGKSEFELHALNGADFPKLPELVGDISFEIEQGMLKKMIAQINFAIAQNDARAALNGAFFKFEGNELTIVSCDGNRLALCKRNINIKSENELDNAFIVPGKSLAEITKLLDDNEECINISLTRKHIILSKGNVIFFSRLIDSEYIDYERLIPKTNKVFVKLDCEQFIRSLERASLVTEDRSAGQTKSAVKLGFTENLIKITSVSVTGRVADEFAIEKSGDDIEIGFNCKYLLDALRSCGTEEIKILMSTPLMSMVIESADDDENNRFLFLVLPVKMKE